MKPTGDEASQHRQCLWGLLLMLVAAAVLTAFSSVAPAGLRKLVLFAVGFGLVTGVLVAWAARENRVSRRVALLVSTILILAGLSVTAARSHAQLVAAQQAANRQNPDNLMGLNMLREAAANDSEVADILVRRQRQLHPEFVDYLATRVTHLGEWSQPWPVVFWIGELCLAVVAGGIVVVRGTPEQSLATSEQDSPSTNDVEPNI